MAVGIYTLPICDGCKLPWLPTGWKQDSDPRSPKKPLRCGKCKSSGWDREFILAQAEVLKIESWKPVAMDAGSDVPRGTLIAPEPRKTRCRHRMKTENCPICSKETARDA